MQGLVIAVQNIDEVIQIIKTSSGTTDAKAKLRERFSLSDKQAQAILDLRLARITKLEVNKLVTELAEIERNIARLQVIINSKTEQMNLIKTELGVLKRNYKVARKSEMCKELTDAVIISEADEKPVETVVLGIAADYTIKRIPLKNFNLSNKEAIGASSGEMLTTAMEVQTDDKVLFFSNLGNCYKSAVDRLNEVRFRDAGFTLSQAFPEAQRGEVPVSVFVMPREENPEGEILLFTRQGMVKRTAWSEYQLLKSSYQGYKGKEGDEVFRVEMVRENTEIFFVTNRGGCVRFDVNEVPLQGRVAGGVHCINLLEDEYLIFAGQVEKDKGEVVMVTDKGFMKRLAVKEITKHARNCKGAKGTEFGNNGTCLVYASYVNKEPYKIAIIDRANTTVVETSEISVESKNHKGKLPKGKKGGIVVEKVVHYLTESVKQ